MAGLAVIRVLLGGVCASVLLVLVLGRLPGEPLEAEGAGEVIPGRYIVVLREGREPVGYAGVLGQRHGFAADVVYRRALRGFAADLSKEEAKALRKDPNVLSVEPDRVVIAFPQDLPTGVDRIGAEPGGDTGGVGPELDVDIAVIDTGVGPHPDLRVEGGFASFAQRDSSGLRCGNFGSWDDEHGHGTHVAGTAAARDNDVGVVGVAPGAGIWSVRVLGPDGRGCMSDVIAGIDWVTANASTIDVANMSVGGGASTAMCNAIANSVAAGITYVAAAGNWSNDAGNSSPANCADVMTVSAIADYDGEGGGAYSGSDCYGFDPPNYGGDDAFASFSNYGEAVDIAAPGVCILSTYRGGGLVTMSGTSMASPHVAGAAARYIHDSPGALPAEVRSTLIAAGECRGGEPVGGDEVCDAPWPGDTDGLNEPLVDSTAMVAFEPPGPDTPTDGDGDGWTDGVDNCPTVATAWFVPAGDADCDGWSSADEATIGTLPTVACAATANPKDEEPDAWPADFNDDQKVNISDVRFMRPPVFFSELGDPYYSPRLDILPDGVIDIRDIGRMAPPVFNLLTSCGP